MMPPTQLTAGAPVEWSKKAIASTVLGFIGFVTLWLVIGLFFAAGGAIFGHLARYDMSVLPLRGRRLATFGLGLGYASMLLFPVLAIILAVSFPAINKWRSDQDEVHRAASKDNASRLFLACEAYARANKDRYPQNWNALSGRYLSSQDLAKLLKSPYPDGAAEAFELVPHDRPVLDVFSDSVVVIQEVAPARVPEIAIVYANGNVSTLHNPDFVK